MKQRPLDAGESILQEAERITHGARQDSYGHPLDTYTRVAGLVSALLAHKLREPIDAHEMALVMCCVKLGREVLHPKRDNRVDLAGFAWAADRILHEAEQRERAANVPAGTCEADDLLEIPRFLRRGDD